MTILKVKDKVGLGQLILAAARDETVRNDLKKDANKMLEGLVDIPANHTVTAYEPEPGNTLLMLPTAEDFKQAINAKAGSLEEALAGMVEAARNDSSQRIAYAAEYDPADPAYIDPKSDPMRALEFLIGDYILKSCK